MRSAGKMCDLWRSEIRTDRQIAKVEQANDAGGAPRDMAATSGEVMKWLALSVPLSRALAVVGIVTRLRATACGSSGPGPERVARLAVAPGGYVRGVIAGRSIEPVLPSGRRQTDRHRLRGASEFDPRRSEAPGVGCG
jgi:hypothetical protein